VILTDHRIVDYTMVQHAAKAIVDTRNAITGHHANVVRLGAPHDTALRVPVLSADTSDAKVVA
jgi:hypothetical protein